LEEKIQDARKGGQKRRRKAQKQGQNSPQKAQQVKQKQQQQKAFNVLKPDEVRRSNPKVLDYSIEFKRVNEPKVLCALCGQPIGAIAEAISEGDNGYSHFDCVIKKIAEDEQIKSDEKISYVGKGVFAVIRTTEENKFEIVKRIAYETNEQYASHKRYVEELKS
jgi:hypothetical protein